MPSTSRRRLLRRASIAAATVAAALAIAPGLASAQSLSSVAIATDSSVEFLVLDVSGASTAPGASVIQWYGNGGANQRWNFVELPNGNEQIVNRNSGQCLTTGAVPGGGLYQWPCTLGARQEWQGTIGKASPGLLRGSRLVNPATGLAVDINGASLKAGAAAISWYESGGFNQDFAYWQL
jgi:Ricin-type beta-trefoil lectin domain-like